MPPAAVAPPSLGALAAVGIPTGQEANETKMRFLAGLLAGLRTREALRQARALWPWVRLWASRDRKHGDPAFASAYREAIEISREMAAIAVEAEMHQRGVEGWMEPIHDPHTGEVLYEVRRVSDRLLERLHLGKADRVILEEGEGRRTSGRAECVEFPDLETWEKAVAGWMARRG